MVSLQVQTARPHEIILALDTIRMVGYVEEQRRRAHSLSLATFLDSDSVL